MLHRSWRDWQPLKMRAVLELVELGYLPIVVTLGPDPFCEQAKSFQVAASAVHKALGHIVHATEWHQFFNVQPLTLTFFHRLNELVPVTVPLVCVQGADLRGIKASDNVHEIPLPAGGHKVHEVLHWILACNTPSLFRSSDGGPVLSPAESLLTWLTMLTGPHLVEAVVTSESHTALAILVTPEELYDSHSPRVGLGLVYKAPYIKTASFSEAFFHLKSASEAEVDKRITDPHLMFVGINEASKVIPLPTYNLCSWMSQLQVTSRTQRNHGHLTHSGLLDFTESFTQREALSELRLPTLTWAAKQSLTCSTFRSNSNT